MQVVSLAIPAVKLITPRRFGDHRGFFSEVFNRRALAAAGIDHEWVQDNHSLSRELGVVRALHYQLPPTAQAKLVRVVAGRVLDVAVDIRRSSPTFGQFVTAILTADGGEQMYVPQGFAHGFMTLDPDTQVIYKVSDYYSPTHERGIRWNDERIGVPWGIRPEQATLSAKDAVAPSFDAAELFD